MIRKDDEGLFPEERARRDETIDAMLRAHSTGNPQDGLDYWADVDSGKNWLGPESTKAETQSDDWTDDDVNHWLRARLEYGIDEEPYNRDLRAPEWAKRDAANAALRTRLDESDVIAARQRDTDNRALQQAAVEALRTNPNIAGRAGALQQEQAQRQIAAQMAQRPQTAASGRASIMAQAQQAGQLGTSTAMARAREQLAMQQAYAKAQAGLAQGDRQGFDREAQYAQNVGTHRLGQERTRLGYLGRGMNAAQNDVVRAMDLNNMKAHVVGTRRGRNTALHRETQQAVGNAVAGGVNLAGNALQSGAQMHNAEGKQTSDVRAKEGVSGDDESIRSFLGALKPYSYSYREPERHGEGRHTGVMAQDLEKSAIGERMVGEGPDGMKTVDYSPERLGPVTLASLADLHRRIEAQERKR